MGVSYSFQRTSGCAELDFGTRESARIDETRTIVNKASLSTLVEGVRPAGVGILLGHTGPMPGKSRYMPFLISVKLNVIAPQGTALGDPAIVHS